MTKQTASPFLALVLSAAALCACGTDPYSGDSSATETTTETGPATKTVTSSDTVTGTYTGTETMTATAKPTHTATHTGTSTEPLTVTVTTTMTVTGTSTEPIDAGMPGPDAAPADPNHRDTYITVAPNRLLDLVVMIDNSPSMAPKVAKLNAQFPKLIAALKDPNDGMLPDLRVALINSDLGSGGAYPSGSCGPKTLPDGTSSAFGDLGRFQMLKTPTACTFNDGAQFLEYKAGLPINYAGDINTVFACLASNVGTMGCGLEHQLQAFEFALAATGVGNDEQQTAFLRSNAYLGLVFLSDEDDCSAATNDALFGDKAELRGESASLRCATRAHSCGGKNLSISSPGFPTTAAFTAPFSTCQARVGDECGDLDTSGPTTCNPLKNVKTLADKIKELKSDPDQIFVAGIFGWPLSDADMATAQYKIAPIPNPNTADTTHPTVYDYWPVCYDPDHLPSKPDSATGFDGAAAGWGATGGLREAVFVDEFGDNGMKLSICERDYSASMKKIGDAMAKKLSNLCMDEKLLDSDLAKAGVQPECRVTWRIPQPDPKDPTKVIYVESAESLPQCEPGATMGNVAMDCWQLMSDANRCPVHGQLLSVLRTAQEIKAKPILDPGTKLHANCHVCAAPSTDPGCVY
jgi:hypothetical protein